jgi:3-oxoacyl-[acyl-carrier protein] reductase
MNNLKDKTAIVTGASRGIGRAIALELASKGCNVVVNFAGNETAALETVKLCEEAGVKAVAMKGDVSDEAAVNEIVNATHEQFGSIDILVNNAGITRDNLMLRMSAEDFDEVISKNLRGAFLMTKYAGKIMLKQRSGRIVNISSIVGLHGNAGQANYSASKAGIIGLTRALALEFAGRGVRVNAIAPGMIMTDMLRGVNQDELNALAATIPEGFIGDVSDIAGALGYLLTAPYVTGQVISPNGGIVQQ